MICLGIEGTAHTLGVGILKDEKILSSATSRWKPSKGGILPAKAAEHHSESCWQTFRKALDKASISKGQLELISFSQGPGLAPCLRVAAVFARFLACKLKLPLIGVNHCIAHLEIGRLLTEAADPVTLYVSGGNTQIIAFSGGRYRVFGETLDIPIGNALDKFALEAGLGHPGGPRIEKLAKEGSYLELPYVVKGMDLSFSGLLTEAVKKLGNYSLADCCFSLQETSFSMLCEVVERAVAHCEKEEVLLTGGVAANKKLQQMLKKMCRQRGAKFFVVSRKYAGDNGAMIGWIGILQWREKPKGMGLEETKIKPNWRTDECKVGWR